MAANNGVRFNNYSEKISQKVVVKINFLLLILASVAIWLWSDALTVEVPFLVPYLPEGWRLGSYLVLMKGLSTSSLLLLPLFLKKGITPACVSCFSLGFLFSISICFLWNKKLPPSSGFFSDGLSLGFLANAFCLMGLDSVRMTLVYMFASSMFSESFMTAVLIGDACGGLFASGISYAQGYKQFFKSVEKEAHENSFMSSFATNSTSTPVESKHPDDYAPSLSTDYAFGPSVALVLLAVLYFTCFAALLMLIYLNRVHQKPRLSYDTIPSEEGTQVDETSPLHSGDRNSDEAINEDGHVIQVHDSKRMESEAELRIVRSVQEVSVVKWYYRDMYSEKHKHLLWFTWFTASGSVFTLMPAFHSFSTLPYGQRCFMLAVSFWSLSFPLTAIVAHFARLRKAVSLCICLVFHIAVCGLLISVASQSPHPPFMDTKWAEPIMILLWVLQGSSGFFLFCTASYCLREMDEEAVKWGSIAAQVGDVVGSFLSFTLVNFSHIFVEA